MIDIHVHYFPQPLFEAIWRFFETRGHGLWPIHYKLHGKAHVETLVSFGVERFTTLVYAHKPGLADYLNAYVLQAASADARMLPFGTIFCGDGEVRHRARRMFEEDGFLGIKLHPFVSGEEVDDPRLFDAYEIMEAHDKVLICHTGSGPVYDAKDGADRISRVLTQFPRLKIVVAHCGAFEYCHYEALAEEHPTVHFDTAMNCVHTPVFPNSCPGREFFLRFQDRILYGSDYPNIPYPYDEQLKSLRALQLGEAVERKIFRENAERLLALPI